MKKQVIVVDGHPKFFKETRKRKGSADWEESSDSEFDIDCTWLGEPLSPSLCYPVAQSESQDLPAHFANWMSEMPDIVALQQQRQTVISFLSIIIATAKNLKK